MDEDVEICLTLAVFLSTDNWSQNLGAVSLASEPICLTAVLPVSSLSGPKDK